MAIIKLTDLMGKDVYLNKNHITSFYRTKNIDLEFTSICIAGIEHNARVQETPEEILEKIREAENGK